MSTCSWRTRISSRTCLDSPRLKWATIIRNQVQIDTLFGGNCSLDVYKPRNATSNSNLISTERFALSFEKRTNRKGSKDKCRVLIRSGGGDRPGVRTPEKRGTFFTRCPSGHRARFVSDARFSQLGDALMSSEVIVSLLPNKSRPDTPFLQRLSLSLSRLLDLLFASVISADRTVSRSKRRRDGDAKCYSSRFLNQAKSSCKMWKYFDRSQRILYNPRTSVKKKETPRACKARN